MADAERRLRELGDQNEDTFFSDPRNLESAKYFLIVAAESAIDLCNHLAACRSARAPRDYADCFRILADLGIIDGNLSERLQRMARFRNLLVHLYRRVEDPCVYRMIREDLGDFTDFRRQVAAWMKKEDLI